MKTKLLGSAAALLCAASFSALSAAPAVPAWVAESNRNADVLLQQQARFTPEGVSQQGVEGYDDKVSDLQPKLYERTQAAAAESVAELKRRLASATDPQVKQDLQILITSAEDGMVTARLANDELLPYFSVSALVFNGIQTLLDPRVSKERQAKAAVRLRRYTGLEPGHTPATQLARALMEEKFADRKLAGPFRGQVEQDLADSPSLVAGVKDLFSKFGITGQDDALAALEKQIKEQDEWVRAQILPRANPDHRLPPDIYADNLKGVGTRVEPQELIRRALLSFIEIQNEMQSLAVRVAKEKGYKSSDYRDVIRELKKNQVTGKAIMPLYATTLAQTEAIIRREHIVTLPARKAAIELSSEAEAAIVPAPHMKPPRLIGNTGEYGVFILPLRVPGGEGQKALTMNDFTFKAAAWTLTAHEARPGHELQFAAMIERGVSIARAVFAFNSVNVEGWGLYSEAEMKPYMPLEGQLISLQARLQRAARAFLDPMLNLGMMQPEEAAHVLSREVGLSDGMVKQEVDRYTFRSPGQATAYFVGYQALMETRERAQLALKEKFNRQHFNDFVIGQGLLPPDLLQKAVMEEFVPAELARQPA